MTEWQTVGEVWSGSTLFAQTCLSEYSGSKWWAPSLILGHNSMNKSLRDIFIERQGILRNIKPALLPIFGQHSSPVSHDQTVHKLNVSVCSSLLSAPRPFITIQALLPILKFSNPFLRRAVRRRFIPKGCNEVVMNFFRDSTLWLL